MRHTTRTVAMIALVAVSAGARATQQASDPPMNFQLGDSVTMPTRAVSGAHESTVAFHLDEKDLLPVSIAYDAKDRSFYVGSARKGKVVRVDEKGQESDFIRPRQDGLGQAMGMKAHAARRMLWVCSFEGVNLEGYQPEDAHASGVFVFHLDTGALIRKWALDARGETHRFHDLALTRANDAYITHRSGEAAIYRILQNEQKLELFMKTAGLTDINGITLSPDETTLFVAGNEGVQAVDIATRKARRIETPEGTEMGGIDGLYHHQDGLLGIRGHSIEWYRLDDACARVTMTHVLERDHPLMKVPTAGVIVGSDFYYVANAQLGAVKPDGRLAGDELTEPVVLKLPLR